MIPKKLLKKHMSVFKRAKPTSLSVLPSGLLGAMTDDRTWIVSTDRVEHDPCTVEYRSAAALAKNAPTEQIDLTKAIVVISAEPTRCDWEEVTTIPDDTFAYLTPAFPPETRNIPHLRAIHHHELGIYATDGHRLHLAKHSHLPFSIPADAALAAARLGDLDVYRDGEQILLMGDGYFVQCQAFEPKGPPIEKILLPYPEQYLHVRSLAGVLKKIPKVYDIVVLEYSSPERLGHLLVTGHHEEYGSFCHSLHAGDDGLGRLTPASYNINYLRDAVTDDCSVFWGGKHEALVVETELFAAFVMPVRL